MLRVACNVSQSYCQELLPISYQPCHSLQTTNEQVRHDRGKENLPKTNKRGERIDRVVDIYESADSVRGRETDRGVKDPDPKGKTQPQHTESRCWRLSVVCLVLLCALLLVAAILLWLKINNKTSEYDQLQIRYDNLTVERVQLQMERNDLKKWISNLTQNFPDGWVYFSFSFYYVSTEKKNWNQSREDCKMRGSNLVIVNSATEQDFVKKFHKPSDYPDWIWIGLSDSEKEGTWKWVDGSPLGSWSIWGKDQPNGKAGDKAENCVAVINDWHDHYCSSQYRWICEKRIEPN